MPRSRSWPTLLALAPVALTGCYLEAPFPLFPAEMAEPDARLVGWWTAHSEEEGTADLLVLPFNEREYYVQVTTRDAAWAEDSVEVLRYRGFAATLRGTTFMNLQKLSEEAARPFFFARYSVRGDTLSVGLVKQLGDSLVSDPAALRAALLERMTDPDTYDDEVRLIRSAEPPLRVMRLPPQASGTGAPDPPRHQ